MIKDFFKLLWDYTKLIFFILFLLLLLLIGFAFVVIIFKGKIYIEIIIIFILIYMFLFWRLWFYFSKRKLIKKYKPEKDLARLAEEARKKLIDNGKTRKGGTFSGTGEVEETKPAAGIPIASIVRPEQPQGREFLQKRDADSVRKNRSGIRKFLRRR